jgi:peptidoglycan/LPS O-acetylase OafA/YrhL
MNNTYRPDIDGLRAIAVLSVILYHAGFATFSGGYVGVDVFFVISGFLITRLLSKEIEETGRIDFFRFYLRRVRRLLPAFFFTLLCTSILAVWFLSPLQLEGYGASLIHSVISASNIYFYSESGYFDTSAALKPLLHTWSLGVEEQFYFIWPFLLYLLAPRKLLVPLFITVAGLISLYFAESMIAGHSDAVFFLMPFRIFEFSIGAILIWLTPREQLKPIMLDGLFFLGLALIAYSVFSYSEKTSFPGVSALIPCMGATLCIYAGNAPQVGKVLKNKVVVGIGLISYSLYLAHWPIIVFYKRISIEELTKIESILLVAASVAIAVFMYFWIEKPFRKVKPSNASFLLACALFSLTFSYLGASMWANEGWAWRPWAGISSDTIKKSRELRFQTMRKICRLTSQAKCNDLVVGAVNALIIGDSHAPDALNAFEAIYPTHNFSMSTLGGCPPYRDIELITPPTHPERLKCKELNIARFDPNYLKQFDYVVINVLFGWYTSDHLREYLDFLKANNIKKVIVFGDYLVLKKDMYDLLNEYGYNAVAINKWVVDSPIIESELKAQVEGLGYYFLSKRNTFCKTGHCELFDSNNIPFTHDSHHLSYEFSLRLAVTEKNAIGQYLSLKNDQNTNSSGTPSLVDLKIGNWGPQSTTIDIVPNKQPGGGMGVWIEASGIKELGEVQVLFAGTPAKTTTVQEKLITAEISPEQLSIAGKKDIAIKRLVTNELFPVGVFDVQLSK